MMDEPTEGPPRSAEPAISAQQAGRMAAALPYLPNLFIPGAAKSGTTTLHDYLARHPDIEMSLTKEPSYFWHPERRLEDFAKLFGKSKARYRGESSTTNMIFPEAMERIKANVPDPRFIFIFRNPVDRAWSHYVWIKGHYAWEKREFREAFLADIALEPPSAKNASLERFYYYTGLYAHYLQRFRDAFGAERIHVVIFEDFVRDPKGNLDRICEFLDLPPFQDFEAIKANPTRMYAHGRLMIGYIFFGQKLNRYALSLLPRPAYLRLLRLNQILRDLVFGLDKTEPPPKLVAEDRGFIAGYYRDEVARLRAMTSLPLTEWAGDFPVE